MSAGRPRSYTPEMGKRICDAVAVSERGLRKTLEADPELPAFGCVQEWLRGVGAPVEFSSEYALAKQRQLEAMAEDIIDIANDDSLDANDKRVRVDARKWILSKLLPRTYGDKLDVTSDGQALTTPSHMIDARVQSIIMQAQKRRLAGPELDLDDNALKLLE